MRLFIDRWDAVLLEMATQPDAELKESMFRHQLDKFSELKELLIMYDMDITHRGQSKDYDKLYDIVQLHLLKKHQDKKPR